MNWEGPNTFTFEYRLPKCATPCTAQVGVFYRDETDTYCVMLEQVRIEHDQKVWSLTDVLSQEVLNTIDKEAQQVFAKFLNKGKS